MKSVEGKKIKEKAAHRTLILFSFYHAQRHLLAHLQFQSFATDGRRDSLLSFLSASFFTYESLGWIDLH